jgi:hypothetical protein
LLTGALSPVDASSCTSSVADRTILPSAGTMSPASTCTRSPGTTSTAGTTPDLKLIIPHGGGAVPYHWGRYQGVMYHQGGGNLTDIIGENVYTDPPTLKILGGGDPEPDAHWMSP